MFPTARNRVIITAAIVVGAAAWLFVSPWLRAADGASGFSLDTAEVGLLAAIALVLLTGLPAMVLGLITSTMGNPISGVFTVATALCVLAWRGGPMDGWMRSNDLPGAYRWLILEMAIWQAGVVVMLAAIQHLRSPMRTRWPALAFDDHLGVDTHLYHPQVQAVLAGLVCAGVGGTIGWFLMRTTASGQVVISLIIAFTIGAMIAHMIFPQTNPIGILFSPALVAVAAYTWMTMRFAGHEQVLKAWFAHDLPGLALAMPIHYISAGVVGCTLGIGWAQAIRGSDQVTESRNQGAAVPAGGGRSS